MTVGPPQSRVKHMLEAARNHPYSHLMTASIDTAVASLFDAIEEFDDLVERYQKIKDLESSLDVRLKEAKARIAMDLYEGRSWKQVGDLLGVTGSRAEQISRAAR